MGESYLALATYESPLRLQKLRCPFVKFALRLQHRDLDGAAKYLGKLGQEEELYAAWELILVSPPKHTSRNRACDPRRVSASRWDDFRSPFRPSLVWSIRNS